MAGGAISPEEIGSIIHPSLRRIRTNRFTRFGTSSDEAITLMGYSKSQWVEMEVTEDHASESVRTVYALKQTSFKGRAKFASSAKLRGDCAFYIFLDESEDVRNLWTSWPVDVPIATRESMSLSLAEGLTGIGMWGSLEALRRDEGLMKLEHGSFTRLYAGGVMPSLDLDVAHDVEGAPMLRARREGGGASSPILLLDLFFKPKNIYGLKETIAVVKETRVPLRFDPTTYVRAPICLFMREGTERLLLTGQGVCLDPIMVMSQGGRITKSWKNKINFLGAGSKLTFWVGFLPGSERPRGLVNVRARYSGILEITAAA